MQTANREIGVPGFPPRRRTKYRKIPPDFHSVKEKFDEACNHFREIALSNHVIGYLCLRDPGGCGSESGARLFVRAFDCIGRRCVSEEMRLVSRSGRFARALT